MWTIFLIVAGGMIFLGMAYQEWRDEMARRWEDYNGRR